jgi:hypothetical protein
MTNADNPLPQPPDDPLLTIQLKRSEIAALISRLVPEGTWMSLRAQKVVQETFRDADQANRVADHITDALIRIHDRGF